jgi:hypothetical protein
MASAASYGKTVTVIKIIVSVAGRRIRMSRKGERRKKNDKMRILTRITNQAAVLWVSNLFFLLVVPTQQCFMIIVQLELGRLVNTTILQIEGIKIRNCRSPAFIAMILGN